MSFFNNKLVPKSKSKLVFTMFFCGCLCLSGCSSVSQDCESSTNTTKSAKAESEENFDDLISGDKIFVPIRHEKFGDGYRDIIEYVKLSDYTVWVAYEVYHGCSFTQVLDKDGKPVIYNGNISDLEKGKNTEE